jgi:hypothetical protein
MDQASEELRNGSHGADRPLLVEKKVKLSIEVTPELNRVIERISALTGTTKSDVMRKALALMDVAVEAKENGERLFVGKTPPPGASREIVGL